MRYVRKIVEYKDYKIQIVQDDDAQDPRSWKYKSEEPTMVCWHRRYTLGDEQPKCSPEEWLMEMAQIYTTAEDPEMVDRDTCIRAIEAMGTVILPLCLYDHSGITMSTGKFGCPWDSGQVGYIYCTKETLDKEGWTKEQAQKYMEGEVETYDDWLTGNVYGYDIETADGDDTGEACWGYYGEPDESGVIDDAKAVVDRLSADAIEDYEKQPKHKHAEMATI
jgi:hypothetical protein